MLIAGRGWTQAEAARALGVTRPRVSGLLRGEIDRFSIDTLVHLLAQAGADVTFTVRRRRSAAWRIVAAGGRAHRSAGSVDPAPHLCR